MYPIFHNKMNAVDFRGTPAKAFFNFHMNMFLGWLSIDQKRESFQKAKTSSVECAFCAHATMSIHTCIYIYIKNLGPRDRQKIHVNTHDDEEFTGTSLNVRKVYSHRII